MDPDLMQTAIKDRIKGFGRKPKAIVVVHLYGMPAKMREIMAIAREYEIPVIEDAAEAMGSEYYEKKAGTIGDIGVYSFNGNKIITTGGGGALISNREDWVRKARFLATQARDPAPHYEHSQIGYNYRLSNVCAAIGRGQLRVLDQRVAQRRANFEFYRTELGSIKCFRFLEEPAGHFANRWLTTFVFDSTDNQSITKEEAIIRLEAQNIESRPFWKPMHLQPVYNNTPFYSNGVSDQLFRDGLCLPSGTQLHKEDVTRIANILTQSGVTKTG
jgi:dTDP-4-amino-4,6-dideoxygalactose transaminase